MGSDFETSASKIYIFCNNLRNKKGRLLNSMGGMGMRKTKFYGSI